MQYTDFDSQSKERRGTNKVQLMALLRLAAPIAILLMCSIQILTMPSREKNALRTFHDAKIIEKVEMEMAELAADKIRIAKEKAAEQEALMSSSNSNMEAEKESAATKPLTPSEETTVTTPRSIVHRDASANGDETRETRNDVDPAAGADATEGAQSSIVPPPTDQTPAIMTRATYEESEPATSNNANEILPSEPKCEKKKCALLFFGIIHNGFKEFILPAIQRNVLSINPDCDVYVHTYNISSIPRNVASKETMDSTVNAEGAYLLAGKDHVKMETNENFFAARKPVVDDTKEHYCEHWGECCTSHTNMIKQWHSLNGAWDLMVQHEKSMIGQDFNEENNHYYDQIGLFRSDVYYVTPVSVFEHEAAVPDFAHYGGLNDRLFYGKREYSRLWAHRFDFLEDYKRIYLPGKRCYHAESYAGGILVTKKVPVVKNDNICVWRVRSGSRVSLKDCSMEPNQIMTAFSNMVYLPVGYNISEGRRANELPTVVSNNENHGELEWPSNPLIDERREFLLKIHHEAVNPECSKL